MRCRKVSCATVLNRAVTQELGRLGARVLNRAVRRMVGANIDVRVASLMTLADIRSVRNHYVLESANLLDRTKRSR